jgi:hypothetical protein
VETFQSSIMAVESQPGDLLASCSARPAPPDEVMMDQLEFLLLHARNGRHPACPQCARLDRVGDVLLAPFL